MCVTRRKWGPLPLKGDDAGPASTEAAFTISELMAYPKSPKSITYEPAAECMILGGTAGRHDRFHRDFVGRWLGATTNDIPGEDHSVSLSPPGQERHA